MPGYMTLEQMMKSPNSEFGKGPENPGIERLRRAEDRAAQNYSSLEDLIDPSTMSPEKYREEIMKIRRKRLHQMLEEADQNRELNVRDRAIREQRRFGFPFDPNRKTPFGRAM